MATDRATRCLSALSGASSSRVLNLNAIGLSQAANSAHTANPLFYSPIINSSIILKHRLRANEVDCFLVRRALATKIIIPFERADLRSGGRSMFVDQRGFDQLFRETGNYVDDSDLAHDINVLRLIDRIPSLDPFLLREQLRSHDIDASPSYFEISPADQQRMHSYASKEIGRLTALANGKATSISDKATSRMVSALLSSEVNEKLEPMRATLNLNPEEFCEGVFSWRGFIYYKWTLNEFWPSLIKSLREIKGIVPVGKFDWEQRTFFSESKIKIIRGAKLNSNRVRDIIAVYDNAYGSLIERQDPKMFRDFLLSAPALFLEIGERMGCLSHITSFWQYRFPVGSARCADADELVAIFEDFLRGISQDGEAAAVLAA
jgi:hypothetical protein